MVIAVGIGLAAAAAGTATWAAFSATSANTGNRVLAGTVLISDDDAGSAMFSLSNLNPGASMISCMTVTYGGSLPATVRLYGTTGGTGLDASLTLTITRGASSSGFGSCATFSADATDYVGQGAGVIYKGTLQAFPDDYAGGVHDPVSGSEATWTTGRSQAFRLVITAADDDAISGKTATQVFTWEARNS